MGPEDSGAGNVIDAVIIIVYSFYKHHVVRIPGSIQYYLGKLFPKTGKRFLHKVRIFDSDTPFHIS